MFKTLKFDCMNIFYLKPFTQKFECIVSPRRKKKSLIFVTFPPHEFPLNEPSLKQRLRYNQISMAQIYLGQWKFAIDMGCSNVEG